MGDLQEEIHTHLEVLVLKRRGLDDIVAEFSTRSPEAEYEAAAKALKVLGRRAQASLIRALADPDAAVRIEALLALGRIGSEQAVDAIVRHLPGTDGDERMFAVEALGIAGDARAYAALFAVLPTSPGPLYEAVVRALLSTSRSRAVADLCALAPQLSPQTHAELVAAVVVENGPEVVSRLERIVGDPTSEQGLCTLKALARLAPDRTLSRLWPLLAYDLSTFRVAFEILNDAQAPGLEAAAVQALQHRDNRVRRYAVEFLGRHGSAEAVIPLVRLLSDESQSIVRQLTLRSLGQLGTPAAMDAILSCLYDVDAQVQIAAAQALGILGDARACDPLIEMLLYSTGQVDDAWRLKDHGREQTAKKLRDATAIALLRVCPSRGITLLYPRACALDPDARNALVMAIASEGRPDAADMLERMPCPGSNFLNALALVAPERALPHLLQKLTSWEYGTFRRAFEILVDMQPPCLEAEAVRGLQNINFHVREYVMEYLGHHGSAEIIPLITGLLLNDPDFRVRAVSAIALARLAMRVGVDVHPDLVRALSDHQPWVQSQAHRALEMLQG
ncbi:MAG: HEAT repeat domain-containing protein [Anaerolineae bacterium]|nr:HEAT repeat domain-containing protein [Anaerolineae bacterium]